METNVFHKIKRHSIALFFVNSCKKGLSPGTVYEGHLNIKFQPNNFFSRPPDSYILSHLDRVQMSFRQISM
jgi:hypothetical protein